MVPTGTFIAGLPTGRGLWRFTYPKNCGQKLNGAKTETGNTKPGYWQAIPTGTSVALLSGFPRKNGPQARLVAARAVPPASTGVNDDTHNVCVVRSLWRFMGHRDGVRSNWGSRRANIRRAIRY